MNNFIPPSSVSGASFSAPLKHQGIPKDVQSILRDLGLDISRVTINPEALKESYKQEKLRKDMEKRIDDIRKSRSTIKPDARVLAYLGIKEDPNALECYVSADRVSITLPFE